MCALSCLQCGCIFFLRPQLPPKYLLCFDKWYLTGDVTASGHSPFSLTVHRCLTVFQRQCSEKSDAGVAVCFCFCFLDMFPVLLLPEGYGIYFSLSLEFRKFTRISPVCMCVYVLIMSGAYLLSPFFLTSQIPIQGKEIFSCLYLLLLWSVFCYFGHSYHSQPRSPGFVSSSYNGTDRKNPFIPTPHCVITLVPKNCSVWNPVSLEERSQGTVILVHVYLLEMEEECSWDIFL